MNIKTALAEARALLHQNNIEQPRLDAEVLLCHVLNCTRVTLLAYPERLLSDTEQQQYQQLMAQRAAGQPVAYLVGSKEFMGLDFTVTPATLIPRPDTELMVETALQLLKDNPHPKLVDVGTGSGAVAVSLAHFVPSLQVTAVDISADALAVAQQNATQHQVHQRMEFILGNLLTPLLAQDTDPVDIITANLPYVPSGDIPGLSREVHCEPTLALDGGPDGLDLYRILLPQAETLLKPGGHLLIEIGPGQGAAALALFTNPRWQAQLYHDLAGRERLVVGQLNHR